MGHTAGRMARQQAAHPQAGGRQAAAAACVRAVPRSTVVVLLLALSAWVLTAAHGSRRDSGVADMMDDVGHLEQMYYFYNEITGEVQWEDPGDVPFEDEMGMRYWLGPSGERLDDDPHMQKYVWVEQFSEDLKRPFFFNYETKETTWERPPDLAWRRIQLHDD